MFDRLSISSERVQLKVWNVSMLSCRIVAYWVKYNSVACTTALLRLPDCNVFTVSWISWSTHLERAFTMQLLLISPPKCRVASIFWFWET